MSHPLEKLKDVHFGESLSVTKKVLAFMPNCQVTTLQRLYIHFLIKRLAFSLCQSAKESQHQKEV